MPTIHKQQLKPNKKPAVDKAKLKKLAIKIPTNKLFRIFDEYCKKIRGCRPVFVRFKDGNLLKSALKHLNEFQIEMLFLWFLAEKKNMRPTIGAALCKEVIGDFIETGQRQYGFYNYLDRLWKKYKPPSSTQTIQQQDADNLTTALVNFKIQLAAKMSPFTYKQKTQIAEEVAARERRGRK